MPPDLLRSLGQRARTRRLERGWTLRDAAERSGVSARFLVQLEAGRGNISVRDWPTSRVRWRSRQRR